MNNMLDVIFLGYDDARHARLAEALSYLGFNVRPCRDPARVHEQFSSRPSPLVVLEAPLPDIHNAAMRLRTADRSLGIVAISAFPNAESRVRTLLCGVDACLPPNVMGLELAAILQALMRRTAPRDGADAAPEMHEPETHEPDAATQETWRLANKGWMLVSPAGQTLALTASERDFLSRLANSPDRKIGRDALLGEEANGATARPRFMDVMISRLRRKAAAREMTVPIRAVHGWGYMFAADIVSDPNSEGVLLPWEGPATKKRGAASRARTPR